MKNWKKLLIVLVAITFLALPAVAAPAARAAGDPANHDITKPPIILVNESTLLNTPLNNNPSETETYHPSSRQWNGCSTVITAGKNIFVGWFTGAVNEPDTRNYVVIAASSDGGNSWRDPFMIIESENPSLYTAMPIFFYNGKGELYLFYVEQGGSGIQSMKLFNADGDLDKITYTAPKKLGIPTIFAKPTILSDGRLMYATGNSLKQSLLYVSEDDGESWRLNSVVESYAPADIKRYSEGTIVEKNDGSLWLLSRLEKAYGNGIEQSYSYDGGKTWDILTTEGKPEQIFSPGARFQMTRLQSGALAFVTNAKGLGTTRTHMTVYLSYDDGETWPYSLLLDPLQSAYPEIYQAQDGKIYIVYDKGRSGGEYSIRLTIVTEEDIKAGAFVSAESRDKLTVTKANWDFADVISVNGAFKREMRYPVGTELKTILAGLPNPITITDSNAATHEIKGWYKVSNFKSDAAGTYNARFEPEIEKATLQDSYNIYSFKVILEKEEKKGCGNSAAVIAPAIAALGLVIIRKKR